MEIDISKKYEPKVLCACGIVGTMTRMVLTFKAHGITFGDNWRKGTNNWKRMHCIPMLRRRQLRRV